jgi:hypothetical protein
LSLLGPSQEDQRKIHAQINQILNQRFLLTTLAITLFGVIASWLIPKAPPSSHQPIGGAAYALALVHSTITFTLFLLQVLLRGTLHLYTTYLVVTKTSGWEQDWTTLRKNRPYTAYSKPISIVFALLNVLIVIFPFTLAIVYDLDLSPLPGMWLLITVGVVIEVLIIGLGFWGWFDNEQRIHDQWVAIQANP